jgi:hypothetical protein
VLNNPEKTDVVQIVLFCSGKIYYELIQKRDALQRPDVAIAQIDREAEFLVDWHLVALPVIQEQLKTDPLHIFKTWLARTIFLAPIPRLMSYDTQERCILSQPLPNEKQVKTRTQKLNRTILAHMGKIRLQ